MGVRGDRHARDRNHAHDHGPVASMWAAALAALTLMVPALVLIVGGNNNGRAAFDSTAYHERFILALAESFPSFDLSNPLTATTPGYHILVATAAQFGAESTMAMRLVSMVVGCAFVATVAAWIARRWDDPAFPRAFHWFDSPRYWQDHINELQAQIEVMAKPMTLF